jgi:predicted PurR-regulated permease PerM
LAGLAALGVYFCYRLAQPCIPSLVWAGALALVFNPVHQYFESKVRNANMAAAFSGLLIGLLVVVPATWFAQKLAEQAISVPENIQKQIAAGKWHIDGGEHPLMAHLLARIEQQVGSPENASMAMAWLKTILSRLIKESAAAVVEVSLTLYFLFYFLRDRMRMLEDVRSILPLPESDAGTRTRPMVWRRFAPRA